MATRENKALVERFWEEVFNRGDYDAGEEIFAADHKLHHPLLSEGHEGTAPILGTVAIFRTFAPDIQVTCENLGAEGDRVVTLWTARGTVAEELRDPADADAEFTMSGIGVFRIRDGRIAETWQRVEQHPDETDPTGPNELCKAFLLAQPRIAELADDHGIESLRVCCWIKRCC